MNKFRFSSTTTLKSSAIYEDRPSVYREMINELKEDLDKLKIEGLIGKPKFLSLSISDEISSYTPMPDERKVYLGLCSFGYQSGSNKCACPFDMRAQLHSENNYFRTYEEFIEDTSLGINNILYKTVKEKIDNGYFKCMDYCYPTFLLKNNYVKLPGKQLSIHFIKTEFIPEEHLLINTVEKMKTRLKNFIVKI